MLMPGPHHRARLLRALRPQVMHRCQHVQPLVAAERDRMTITVAVTRKSNSSTLAASALHVIRARL